MNIYCEFENLKESPNNNKNFSIKRQILDNNIEITNIKLLDKKTAKALDKKTGNYTTIFCKDYDYLTNFDFKNISEILIKELKKYKSNISKTKKDLKIFIVGLGNEKITADSLGQKVVDKIISTSKDIKNGRISNKYFGNVFTLAPSIASKNGIYTFDIINAIVKDINPDLVVLIDSLSCKNIYYLGKTFQINDCGLTPGCEINNKQPTICKKSLNKPVICMGCPLVCNLSNITKTAKNDLVLTLKDINIIVEKCADIIAYTLNRVFHPKLNNEEILYLSKN